MSDNIDTFVKMVRTFGLRKLTIAAVLVIAVVWGVGHFSASAGEPVSVLWGLVNYTKSGIQENLEAKTAGDAPESIRQETKGQDSPAIADVEGDVNIEMPARESLRQ